jgi:thymidylate kinase
VRQVYLERAKNDSERIKIIDASKPLHEVEHQVDLILNSFLERVKA